MATKVAIINCGSLDQEKITQDGKQYYASELLSMKISDFSKKNGKDFVTAIYRPSINEKDFPRSTDYDIVLIPGSKLDIDDEGRKKNQWMETLIGFIKDTHSSSIPLLGICFGHQAIGVSFGSKLGRIAPPQNLELGFIPIALTEEGERDPLFKGIPKKFDAMQFHFRFIDHAPKNSVALANGIEPKILQSFRIGKMTWGVQFHPDYSADNVNEMIARRHESLSKVTDLSKINLNVKKRFDNIVLSNFLEEAMKIYSS